jgi:uncharacterized protein YwqG
MTIDEIKEILRRKAVVFHTGGKRPAKEPLESWVGCVSWKRQDEGVPMDVSGKEMLPIAAIFLKELPFCPPELSGVALVTIFMSDDVFDNLAAEDLSPWFAIRTYESLDDLVPCEYKSGLIKPFPLTPQLVENDFPTWDGGGIPSHIEDIILEMENKNDIEYFDDICEENYAQHKIGGYPAFIQSGYWFGEDYPFVMQISSDEKADFNIVDSGSFYFYYNPQKSNWKVYCDFY